MPETKIVNVLTLNSETEAALMEDMLNQEGIPFSIRSFHDSGYDGIFQIQRGWGCIEAPEEYSGRIKAIHRDFIKPEK